MAAIITKNYVVHQSVVNLSDRKFLIYIKSTFLIFSCFFLSFHFYQCEPGCDIIFFMISITKELCSIFCPKPDRVLQIYHLFLAPWPKAWQTDFLARLLIMICGLARERERERRLLEILNIWHYRSILPLKSFSLDLEWVVQKFLVKIKFRREQVLDKMKMDILSFLGEKRLMSRTDQY